LVGLLEWEISQFKVIIVRPQTLQSDIYDEQENRCKESYGHIWGRKPHLELTGSLQFSDATIQQMLFQRVRLGVSEVM
jgi:protoheme ferro-lyase